MRNRRGERSFALVDARDYVKIAQYRWYVSSYGYAARKDKRRFVFMHDMIADPGPGLTVDHRNHNLLDNRRRNLRVCTWAENQRHRRKFKNNTSGYKGVSFQAGKWVARITADYKSHYLGRFATAIEAARAYDEAAVRLHGEFAHLNFKRRTVA